MHYKLIWCLRYVYGLTYLQWFYVITECVLWSQMIMPSVHVSAVCCQCHSTILHDTARHISTDHITTYHDWTLHRTRTVSAVLGGLFTIVLTFIVRVWARFWSRFVWCILQKCIRLKKQDWQFPEKLRPERRRMLCILVDEVDKGCLMIRMGVSGWMFLLVPAYPGSPGQTAVKRLCVCVCIIMWLIYIVGLFCASIC